jgi:Ca2+-binding EF-hand superfamily protein
MKRTHLFAAVLLCAAAMTLQAQDKDKPAEGQQRRPANPLFAALDANGDGVIDANEINNAPAALRKLDKNGDGKLTREELRPAGGGNRASGDRQRKRQTETK